MSRLLSFLLASSALMASLACAADDWPMLAHDVRRSGATADEIRPPFARKWYRMFPDEGIQSGAQPVVAANRVFIGTLRGNMHALDTATGSTLWTTSLGSPILHTAAVYQGMVFFGSADGSLWALNASDGTRCWRLRTGAGIWNSPLVHEDRVYVGSRDGWLYAVDAVLGAVKWRSDTGGPILNSPALDEQRGTVYIGSETMHVHAFAVDTGAKRWVSPKLSGASFRGYHPVLAPDGAVLVTSMPVIGYDRFQELLLEMVKAKFGDFASWRHTKAENDQIRAKNFAQLQTPGALEAQLRFIRDRLDSHPEFQTFFVLDPATGRPRFTVPIVASESMNGPGAPPVVTAGGQVVVKFQALLRSRYEHYSPFMNVGALDTVTGRITPLMDQSRTYGWHDSLLLVHDEQSQLAAAGPVLINTHQDNVNAMDLDTRRGYEAPFAWNVHEPAPGEAFTLLWKTASGQQLTPGNEWLPRGGAVYGGGSALDTSVVIAGHSFYYLPRHELNAGCSIIAYEMTTNAAPGKRVPESMPVLSPSEKNQLPNQRWDWDTLRTARLRSTLAALPFAIRGTADNPLWDDARKKTAAISDEQLEQFLLGTLGRSSQSSQEAAGLRTRADTNIVATLNGAVMELLSSEWQPLVIPAAKAPEEAYRFFNDPAQTLWTLAMARPFLEPKVRERVDGTAQKLLARLDKPFAPERGVSRVSYATYPALMRIRDDQQPTTFCRLYAEWRWFQASGDTNALRFVLQQAADVFDQRKATSSEGDCGNMRLAALISCCRAARTVGDSNALHNMVTRTVSALRERLIFELAHTRGGIINVVPQNRSVIARWRNLTPEVADFLNTFAPDLHKPLCELYVDFHRPGWWLAWNVDQLMRNEAPVQLPSTPMEIFSARALLLRETAPELQQYIDIPWCKADEFYIRKLALLLGSGEARYVPR